MIRNPQLEADTKIRLLLDFSRGAQRVSPVCCGLLLSSDGYAARKQTSLHTTGTAMPPSFALQSLISKGQWYKEAMASAPCFLGL